MALKTKYKALNILETIGYGLLKALSTIIAIPYHVVTGPANFIDSLLVPSKYRNNKDHLDNLSNNIYREVIGGYYISNVNRFISLEKNKDGGSTLTQIVFAIINPLIFPIIAIGSAAADMGTRLKGIVEFAREEERYGALWRLLPVFITGLVKMIMSPLRGLSDGLVNSFQSITAVNESTSSELKKAITDRPLNHDSEISLFPKVIATGALSPLVGLSEAGLRSYAAIRGEIKKFYVENESKFEQYQSHEEKLKAERQALQSQESDSPEHK